jgi:hypothetical protein
MDVSASISVVDARRLRMHLRIWRISVAIGKIEKHTVHTGRQE